MEMDKYKQTIRKYHDDMCDNYYQLVRNMKSRMLRRLEEVIDETSRGMISQRTIEGFCNDLDNHLNTMLHSVILREIERYCDELEKVGRVETQVEEEVYNLQQGKFERKITRMVEERITEYLSELKSMFRKSELDERMLDELIGESKKSITSVFGMYEQEFNDKRISINFANQIEKIIAESKMEKDNEIEKNSDGFIPSTPMPNDVASCAIDFDVDLLICVSNPSLIYYKDLNTGKVRQVTDSEEYLNTILTLESSGKEVLDLVRNSPILLETIEKANEISARKNEKKDPSLTDPFLEAEKANNSHVNESSPERLSSKYI